MEIISGTRVNGAILHCLLLSRELARRGHRVTLVCLAKSWIAAQAAGVEGIEVVASDLHRWPTDELRRLAEVVRQRGIDVIHTHTSRANFFGILLRWFSGVPSVATAHSRHIQLHWMFNDRVIAVSEASRRYQRSRNFVRDNRIETIYNFIDHDRLAAAPPEARSRIRRSLKIGETTPLLGVIGNVIPRKGLIHSVGAMPKILSAMPEARLLVVGGRDQLPYAVRVRAVARRLGVADCITWVGQRDDVQEILAALDLYVSAVVGREHAAVDPGSDGRGLARGRFRGRRHSRVRRCRARRAFWCRRGTAGRWPRPLSSCWAIRLGGSDLGEAGRRRVHAQFSPESQTTRIETAFARAARRRAA